MAFSVIRWAGSKRKILPKLRSAYEQSGSTGKYIEPFCGSAALFLELQPSSAVLADANLELVMALTALRDRPREIFDEVSAIPISEEIYYKVRAFTMSDEISPEARFFYLNRLCFNGIYRTNKSGHFNVPYGGRAKPATIPPWEKWSICSESLKVAEIRCGDFHDVVDRAAVSGDFVYLDPPYAVSNRRVFKQYSAQEFGEEDLVRLTRLLESLDSRGAKFLVSYAQSPETKFISTGWNVRRTLAQRNVAGFAQHRRRAVEVLISNF